MTSEELQTMACNYDDAALRELATLRGRVLTEQQVRVEVLRALGELMQAYHDTSVPFDAAMVGARTADRVTRELAGAVVEPSEAEVATLTERRDALLRLVAKLTRETPYPAELDECRSARSALIAEVGTLRAKCEDLRSQLPNFSHAETKAQRDALIVVDVERRARLRALLVEPAVTEERCGEIERLGWTPGNNISLLLASARQLHTLLAGLRQLTGTP